MTQADEVRLELLRRRADLVPHGATTLARHLEGVHAALLAWRQPPHVCLAGLLHSAYSTESFSFRLFSPDERPRVRELIGRPAEHLVFAFCVCARSSLSRTRGTHVRSRLGGTVALSRRERALLMVIHAANLAEQSDLASVSATLALLASARARGVEVPACDAETGEPLILTGLRALAEGRGAEAHTLGVRALAALAAWGVVWDRRLALARWRELAELLVRDGRTRDRELEAAVRRASRSVSTSPAEVWAQLDLVGAFARAPEVPPARSPTQGLPPRFADYIAGLASNDERPLMQFYPGLRATPWHRAAAFPIVRDLERLAPAVAREAKAIEEHQWQDEAEGIGRTGRWRVHFLLEMGRRREDNLARCPSLRWILAHHRTLTTHAGLMYFSCIDPGSRVAPHRGPTNVRLRCHLALEVPRRGCALRVGGVTRRWEPGRCVVFDDSFEHEVWNESGTRRVVLVLDLWHPDLSDEEIALLDGLHRYGAANGTSTQRYWARNDAAAASARQAQPEALADAITESLRAGELERAGRQALRYAQVCRPTRWYPVLGADPPLPASPVWERVLSTGKLEHDIQQLEYLQRRGVLGEEMTPIIARYESLLDALAPLGAEARVPLVGAALAEVGHVYNRLVHVRASPRVKRALSSHVDGDVIEEEYWRSEPNVVVVDDFLSPEALDELRRFCLESTVWSMNRYDHGRLGSFFRDGFNSPLLIQIAEELRAAFPSVIGRQPMTQLWAYKYATTQPELAPHADFAGVNVNFWVTPDAANLDPEGGGLVVFDVTAPQDWDFQAYNRDARKIRAFLASRGARRLTIPYRCNRAVIFDSDLFHLTPSLTFAPGYENRRVNVTVLYGERSAAAARAHRPSSSAGGMASTSRTGSPVRPKRRAGAPLGGKPRSA